MTALLHLYDLSYTRGSKVLFEDLSLSIGSADRVGLVGHNGSGKSSLMSLIVGGAQPDDGEVQVPRGLRVALVEQFAPVSLLSKTLEQALLDVLPEEQRVAERFRVDSLLQQLRFRPEQSSLDFGSLSGGEQNLILLAQALLSEPDLLLMDEPGNHMDIEALTQLQNFLKHECKIPFLMISHDRELLDTCCNRTLFLRDLRLHAFDLPYSAAREALIAQDQQAECKRGAEQKEIRRVEASAKRLARWGKDYDNEDLARKAKSMQKRVQKLKDEQTQVSQGSGLDLQLKTDAIRAKSALTLENLQVTTPDTQRQLVNCEFQRVKPGERIALLGKNGAGKSSTLNLLLESYANPSDMIRFNPNTNLGFYDQELRQFSTESGRFDWLHERCEQPDGRIKQVLLQAGVAFADFDQAVNSLSGGECARLMFMLFRLNQPNFLILDEPTNHIDLEGREQLEEQLISCGATLLITSHDRQFIEKIATRLWWINDNGSLEELNDLKTFYDSVENRHHRPAHKIDTSPQLSESAFNQVDSEEDVLERIEKLETLLAQDKARKSKFQKPEKQCQWQEQLDELWKHVE